MYYSKLLTKEYINEYQKDDYLELSYLYNNIEFIILLITVITIIAFPIIIKLTSGEPKTQNKGTINPEYLQNNQDSDNLDDEQKHLDDNNDDYPEYPEYSKPIDDQNSINCEAPQPINT